jgi:hypothetical protein
MNRRNTARLEDLSRKEAATPTVYDISSEQIVDVGNDDWLQNIVESS